MYSSGIRIDRRKDMAAIHDLLAQVQDEALRARLEQEINRLSKTKKFGLVFEEHLPECIPLYDIPVKKGSTVAKKTGGVSDMYEVSAIKKGVAVCYHKVTEEKEEIPIDELVCVAQFGEPIYPYLKPIDSVCNAPDSDLWHTLIEADNYHALQLLEYLYAGKVDCIYIDPPYNTGARDWKYNNDYVDSADSYRHSKWLSMMQKRLKIAKKLLNSKDSVLIVTIDEKEYLHLGCLLEEMFQEANIQMISSRINATGIVRQNEFTRVDEYIYFVMIGASVPLTDSVVTNETKPVQWHGLWRRDIESRRGTKKGGVAQFYPIYVNDTLCKIEKIGAPLSPGIDRNTVEDISGCTAVFPMRPDGTEMNWGLIGSVLEDRIKKGYVRVKRKKGKKKEYTIEYLTSGYIRDIENGKAFVHGYSEDGSIIASYGVGTAKTQLPTQWNDKSHYSKEHGTGLLRNLLCAKRFSFPKSLYAVRDCIRFFTANKPNALILDFFAGSGTTLHAINLINSEDNGKRRCILVTNNEVSEDEAKELIKKGCTQGDDEWERIGIAHYVTWPRVVCSIEGHDIEGKPLKGNYLGSERPMSEGFKTNAIFFKLGFLDKTSVSLGKQLSKLMPVLWLKAGAYGECPQLDDKKKDMLLFPENKFAVLMNESYFREFDKKVKNELEIKTVYIVTDSEAGYREMISGYVNKDTYQLYRDYLDNFRINIGR